MFHHIQNKLAILLLALELAIITRLLIPFFIDLLD